MSAKEILGGGLCKNIIPIPESKKVKPLDWRIARFIELKRTAEAYTVQLSRLLNNSTCYSQETQDVDVKLSQVQEQLQIKF